MKEGVNDIIQISLLVFFVSSMMGVGLSLVPRALLAPLRDKRFVLMALAANFVVAPALALLLTIVVPLAPPHATGLLLLGSAAGAPFLPKLAEVARADAVLSVALMVLLTLGTVLFMPLALPFLAPNLQANPWNIARPMLGFILLPLGLGMFIRGVAAGWAARGQIPLSTLASLSLGLVLLLVVARDFRALIDVVGSGAIAVAILYVGSLFLIGHLLGGPQPQVRGVMGLGTAARNIGAAFIPATSTSSDPGVITMLVVGTLVIVGLLFVAARWLRRHHVHNL